MTEDLFTVAATTKRSNVPEMSVSELAFSLKRTLEETYGRVRVRGELSGLKLASSGHLYGDLKDEDSVINIVCWKGTMAKLGLRPEDGLDVVITGKMTSYPKNSRYQLVIDSMELAGEGALLKMLEDRRKKLAAEGLFDENRKKPIPFLPNVIGVVTSPTGAVIRDIIHRISERFPRHILVWPVAVQGTGAADQIATAIQGFNAMAQKPDLIIVARGGGSLEDLMAFNEENVVRAAAASVIPLISAVGHETDTTLIDYAADLRAPTPTGAAERSVPVRIDLLNAVRRDEQRMTHAVSRRLSELSSRLEAARAKLGDPAQLLNLKAQTLDNTADKLLHGFERMVSRKSQILAPLVPRHPRTLIGEKTRHLSLVAPSLERAGINLLKDPQKHLDHTVRMLESLSFKKVLERGYAVVRGQDGKVVSTAQDAQKEDVLALQFKDEGHLNVRKA
ncbi:MAG: exodeoxyribonuclease VII large subunit [Micavibrio aeruginosavorus]|uniref:Exodeoxyribonuclease 7 large subunit n=1 Tax=Micavibrio aeruginosavorus TaxID=349221 RepID=A0A2W5N498_9BACT|nr:MAG: exodeoxyribonuclease VII large subunit [Micavibrio aeruginosavorus]